MSFSNLVAVGRALVVQAKEAQRMVRSQWMAPVFGVLALAGLARGQATPSDPLPPGEAKEHFVTVQEAGKPAQRCKVLKIWTEPDGTRAFQAQALDTGELMTLLPSDPTAPAPGVLVRSAAMRIFHWGHGDPVPVGTPQPPPGAVVLGYPIDLRPATPASPEPPRIAAVPTPWAKPASQSWPSAFSFTAAQDHPLDPHAATLLGTPPLSPLPPAAPAAKKVDLTPLAPVVANPVKAAPAVSAPSPVVAKTPPQPVPSAPSPYLTQPATTPIVKVQPEPKPATLPLVAPGASPYAAMPESRPLTPPGPLTRILKSTDAPPAVPGASPYSAQNPDAIAVKPLSQAKPTIPADFLSNASPYAASPPAKSGDAAAPPAPCFLAWVLKPPPAALAAATPVAKVQPKPQPVKLPDVVTHPIPQATASAAVAVSDGSFTPAHPPGFFSWALKQTRYAEDRAVAPPPLPASLALEMPDTKPSQPVVPLTPPPPVLATPAVPSPGVTVMVKPVAPPVPAPPAPPAPKTPVVVAKVVDTPPAPPADVRPAPAKAEPPPAPVALPPLPGPPTVTAPTKSVELPHAQPRSDDPLNTPDKYARLPHDFFGPDDKPAPEKKAPVAMAAARPSPTAAPKASANPPALQPLPGPAAAPTDAQPVKSEAAKPLAPLGMQSVLAAASPELAPPAPAPKAPASAAEKAAMGLNPNEPNAFSDGTKNGKPAGSANAFSEPAAPEPTQPGPDALAGSAFPTPPPGAPAYLPSYVPPAVAMRTMTPAPAPVAAQTATGYVVPAGYRQESGYGVPQLATILHESLYPSQREWAAETLASMDWRRQPEIVEVLLDRAKDDPAPIVRAECIRSLGRMKADALNVVDAIKALRADPDDRVRQEAEETYGILTGAKNAP